MAAIRLFVDKFQRVVTIDEDHPLAIAQRANDASNPAAAADTRKASAPAASTPPASTTSTIAAATTPEGEETVAKTGHPASIFDLPPELRGIPAVQAHLEGLSRKDLQELAKQHEIPANQSSSDLVELLTLTLTTPAP